MLGLLQSEKVVAAVVVGIPLVLSALVVLGSRRRLPAPVLGAAVALAVVITGVAVWAVFRAGPSTLAAGAQEATVPGATGGAQPQPPTAPPPATAPPATEPPAAQCSPGGTTVQVAARGIAFDTDCLAAPAETAFTIHFDNQDAGIPHNVHILSASPSEDPNAQTLFMGELFSGPRAMDYAVRPLPAGTYFFHCDAHPTQMTGTFVVA